MTTTINASNSGSGGLVQTADASGILALQTAGTTAVTVDTSQNATFAGYASLPNTFGFKNRIINGAMVIDQRNAGASVTPTNGQYLVDRFYTLVTAASKFTAQQDVGLNSFFNNSLRITSSSAYSVAAGDVFALIQKIEGFNIVDFGWGTANAKTVTLSFVVNSSLTGTFGGSLMNASTNRSYPFTFSIPTANIATNISVTITGDTAGTWGTANGTGILLSFSLGTGTTFSGTAGAWGAGEKYSATGAISVVGTNGATWYVTGVQLEKSSIATSFDVRPYGTELGMCLRYYQILPGIAINPAATWYSLTYATPMRASPSVSGGAAGFTITTPSAYVGNFYQNGRTDLTLTFSAEL